MISAVSFKSDVYKGFLNGQTNDKGEKVVVLEKPQDSFIKKAIKSTAYAQKAYILAKEGIFGLVSSILAGLTAGAAVLGLDWFLVRTAGRGVKDQSLLTTPVKTIAGIVGGIAKKASSVFDKNLKQIIKYPFIGFPKDIYNYVKNAKGCSRFGKATAVAIGLGVAGTVALGTLININRSMADVDHGFRVGHNR